MLITRKSIFGLLVALFVLAAFGIAGAAQIGGMRSNSGPTLPPTLNNFVSPAGVGDTLIYNYYNARGNATFFTVVNTDASNGIRARVRFREAADIAAPNPACADEPRGSFELLDFDICLSTNDMWAAKIEQSADGNARLCVLVGDQTMTWFGPNAGSAIGFFGFAGVPGADAQNCIAFKDGAHGNPAAGISADNTLEGYFEIIGERTIEGEPTSCNPVDDTNIGAPTNSLFGNAAIIHGGSTGTTFTYDATAIADFAGGDIQDQPTTSLPDLTSGQDGLAGVNFILAKNQLFSIYDLSNMKTEFIVTLPTKALTQVCDGDDIFDDNRVTFQFFDNDEKTTTGSGCVGSPCTPVQQDNLPFEVNAILPKTGNSIMVSDVEVTPLVQSAFNFGWFVVNLNADLSPVLDPAHANPFPAIVPAAVANGWPSMGLTLMNPGAFPMQFTTDIFNPIIIIP